jgi:hypothetical protein
MCTVWGKVEFEKSIPFTFRGWATGHNKYMKTGGRKSTSLKFTWSHPVIIFGRSFI